MLEYPEDYTCDGQTDIFDFLDSPEGTEENNEGKETGKATRQKKESSNLLQR